MAASERWNADARDAHAARRAAQACTYGMQSTGCAETSTNNHVVVVKTEERGGTERLAEREKEREPLCECKCAERSVQARRTTRAAQQAAPPESAERASPWVEDTA